MKATRATGFTLIEVLVALAVIAITLAAGLQATGALTRASARQSDQWLAQLCAENELTRLRLQRQLPGVGDSEYACVQAGRTMRVRMAVLPTPNPNFRRVDTVVEAVVGNDTVRLLSLSTVMGRY